MNQQQIWGEYEGEVQKTNKLLKSNVLMWILGQTIQNNNTTYHIKSY